MGQKKLLRFAEIKTFPNVLQFPENIKGKWHDHFENNRPITLELACGKGEYALGLALRFPQKNFLGIDIKGNRLWVGAKKALELQLSNVTFLRIQIDKITDYFEANEVEEIWITFPDPQLRFSKMKKRLTHPQFLRRFHQILKQGGYIHLKTDSPDLYHFTKEVCSMYRCSIHTDYNDLYQQENLTDVLKIKTHYENLDIAQSNRIHYICFSLPEVLAGKEMDSQLKIMLKDEFRSDDRR
ncbi:MAG: tRNA (guanosine(46)-N7)-methyltransferase TrmB [Chitinophagaceae bacterium]|jgi:tRNA (guanine-N7-)-methyltransferase|nr:tRNA (guanosine(46)-N7)-methyltransferase TrmB [Chitinophagaceae bacterium]